MVYTSLVINLIGQRSPDVVGRLLVSRDVIGCEDFLPLQSSQPITSRLTDKRAITSNQVKNQRRIYHLLTFHNSLDSEDDFRSGCPNVSQGHHKQSFSGLHSPG